MSEEIARSTPVEEGINPEFIIDFINGCEKENVEIHGLMIARNNKIIFEGYNSPYRCDIPHIMHSFTKILTNTAVALTYEDGLLALSDPILKYFPEYRDTANDYLKKCTIRDLITMRNGQERSIGGNEWRPLKTSWKDAYFSVPFDKDPGITFMYSSGNSYILSYIVQKLQHKTCKELIYERIGEKIGLTDFPWMLSPEGVCSGGNGVELTTEDMLRIGLLYLNQGRWGSEQLIPEEWVELAMGFKDPIPPVDGVQYNYHWEHVGDIWAGKGMFGQICGLIPSLNMVFAITSADQEYKAESIFQKNIVNRVKNETFINSNRITLLNQVLIEKGLRMTLKGKNHSVKEHITPKEIYHLTPDANVDHIKKVEIQFKAGNVSYSITDDRGTHVIIAGIEKWMDGVTSMTGAYLHHQYEKDDLKVCAMAYWCSADTLMMEWRYPEMAFFDHLSVKFETTCVRIHRWVNMNSQDLSRPELIAR